MRSLVDIWLLVGDVGVLCTTYNLRRSHPGGWGRNVWPVEMLIPCNNRNVGGTESDREVVRAGRGDNVMETLCNGKFRGQRGLARTINGIQGKLHCDRSGFNTIRHFRR